MAEQGGPPGSAQMPADVPAALRRAAELLVAVSDTARLDAELLMAHALGMERSALLLRQRDLDVPDGFAALVNRRLAHEPVAHIMGVQPFYGLSFAVTPDVLIPRSDSETLIDAAHEALMGHPPRRILDLGTGSGALLLTALHLWPQATGLGVDRSTAALGVAQGNASALGLAERAAFKVLDWHRPGALDTLEAPFDLLLCNPPYVETGADLARQVRDYEPAGALFAGSDGLDDYRHLMPLVPPLIGNSGVAIFELGAGQYPAVAAVADAAGLLCDSRADLGGHLRALLLRSRPK